LTRIKAQSGINGQGFATAGLVMEILNLSMSVLIILFFGAIAGIGLTFLAAIFKVMAEMRWGIPIPFPGCRALSLKR
jgi:hypothetical protein